MFQHKPRRFRRRPNDRNDMSYNNSRPRIRTNQFSDGQPRNSFRPSLSAEKSLEKYTSLAKEAMSAGDKTISENYLQHADHFMRIIENKNINQNQNRIQADDKLTVSGKRLAENIGVNQDKTIEKKEEKKE